MKTTRRLRIPPAFTLVELLVSMTIILLLLVVLVGMVNQTSTIWRSTTGRIEQFRQARDGFESMTRQLSQATLNTYLDYVDANGAPRTNAAANAQSIEAFVPARYVRQSELRMMSGPGLAAIAGSAPRPTHAIFFQAPLGVVADTTDYGGLDNLLNTWGYYVEFNNDGSNADGSGLGIKPKFVHTPDRYRFRLMEMRQPSESMSVYKYTSGNAGLKSTDSNGLGMKWFTDGLAQSGISHVLAENIVSLVILPKLSPGDQVAGNYSDGSLTPDYRYDSTLPGAGANDPNLDSKNQLPPVVTVTMVAVDETSYNRFQGTLTVMPSDWNLDTLFTKVGDTKDPTIAGFAQDLQSLENTLQSKRLTYRVFTTDVSIKSAKWSRSQKN